MLLYLLHACTVLLLCGATCALHSAYVVIMAAQQVQPEPPHLLLHAELHTPSQTMWLGAHTLLHHCDARIRHLVIQIVRTLFMDCCCHWYHPVLLPEL
jgi:hypothetical protein